ncbi:MAG: DNA-binding protein [Clostridia bacterium]
MKAHVFRLHRGDDLYLSIAGYAREHAISAGYIACCVGCVSRARVRDASGITLRDIAQEMEIVSVTGTVSAARCHLHIALSKEDLSTVGGHLTEGCLVNTTAEVVLCELENFVFSKEYDAQTGYDELAIAPHEDAKRRALVTRTDICGGS